MRKFSISKLSMDRNKRILAGFAVLIISLSLLYKFIPPGTGNSLLTWRDYPCDDDGYPKPSVILINGKKYDLPIFKNPNLPVHLCPKNLNTFNETIVVNSASADYEWEIVLPDSSIVFYWEFPKQKNVSRHYDLKREYLIKKEIHLKNRIKGSRPCVLVYNINLTSVKDTVLHFYYYNICEQDKPEAERHANYHLQIELKFKDAEVKV